MLRLCSLLLVLASVVPLSSADDHGFQAIAPSLNALRAGSGSEVLIRFGDNSFSVLGLTETTLSTEKAKGLLPKEPGFPRLKFSEEGNWIEHEVDKDTTLEEPISSKGATDPARKWKKSSWSELGTFNRALWSAFVEFAITNGLCGIEETRYKGRTYYTMSFSPLTPAHIEAGDRTLVLDSQFASLMRFSPKYPPKSGAKGFVILLHDPHENVPGRFQTLTGVRSLITENSGVRFRFLVEGAYDGPSRVVTFSGLDKLVGPNSVTTPAVVQSLLRGYLINVPMAYRLLYDRKISTFAIDNNELLAYPAPHPVRSVPEQLNSLERILKALEQAKLPKEATEAKSTLENVLTLAFVYLGADLQDAPDSTLVDYYKTLGELYESIGEIGSIFSKAGFSLSPSDLQALVSDARGCKDESAIYEKARKRNDTMAPLIIDAAMASSQQMPIAFIGSYHTSGILAELKKASIGYVVIEPRPFSYPTEKEHREFDLANHPNTRRNYLSTTLLNMGRNGPTAIEVTTFYEPKITTKIADVRKARLATQAQLRMIPDSAINAEKLFASAGSNGSLASAGIGFGGGSPPPGNFGKAFAYFDPSGGGSGRGPHFTIVDATDGRWKSAERYGFLATVLFQPSERSEHVTRGSSLMFYPDPISGRLFFTYYEPKSNRYYCFEGDRQQAVSLVPVPIGDSKEEQNIRTQVVELITTGSATGSGR